MELMSHLFSSDTSRHHRRSNLYSTRVPSQPGKVLPTGRGLHGNPPGPPHIDQHYLINHATVYSSS